MWILPALALLGATPAPPPATIFATIGHSEWCPAGNVQLDLATGDYALTPRAARAVCQDVDLVRPVRRGRLDAAPLAAIRAAYVRAQAEGLDACRRGDHQEHVISNGGTPILVLTSGARTIAAPRELNCWSRAASALHKALDVPFASAHQR